MTDIDCAARPLWQYGVRELAALVRSRAATAAQVVDAHLDRIAEVNPQVNAVTVVLADRARELAADIDRRLDGGEQVGALAGVPFCVKENIDLTWSATTNGWTFLADAVPTSDATMVARLMDAGAIPIARGNMPDFGLRWDTDNDLFGRTYNPWDRDRVPGAPAGATRSPSPPAWCRWASATTTAARSGCRRTRPASARSARPPVVSRLRRPGASRCRFRSFFAVNGPIARSVDDLDAAFALMHGADGRDPLAVSIPHPTSYDGPRRVAVVRDPLGWGVDPQVADAIDRAAGALADAGWQIVDADPPLLEEAAVLWRQLSTTEMVGAFQPGGLPAPLSEASTTYFLDNASETQILATGEAYGGAWAYRMVVAAAWEAFQQQHPIILGPVSARRMPPSASTCPDPQRPRSSGAITGCSWRSTSSGCPRSRCPPGWTRTACRPASSSSGRATATTSRSPRRGTSRRRWAP